jgi:hypothetical protein
MGNVGVPGAEVGVDGCELGLDEDVCVGVDG